MINESGLLNLNRELKKAGYFFVCPTPETQKRVIEKNLVTESLRDLFGWSKEVEKKKIPKVLLDAAEEAGVITTQEDLVKSNVRFSSLDDLLFVHSSYPTIDENSVFFGPDSYRFVRFLKEKISSANSILDIGCGSGVGAIALARSLKEAPSKIYLTDVNDQALAMSRINARAAGVEAEVFKSDLFKSVPSGAELVIANPPFIMDESSRAYRDGGDQYATELSVRIVESALEYLQLGATLAMYSGSCIVSGRDQLRERLSPKLRGIKYRYEEIDPDIFGEELSKKPYEKVERIAAIGLLVTK